MNSQSMEGLVRQVLEKMATGETAAPSSPTPGNMGGSPQGTLTKDDYPLATKHPELVKTGSGKMLDDITLENVLNEKVQLQDIRITPGVLRYQAEIARSSGFERLAMNLERAAELTSVPDERILEIYNALRPYRSSQAELHSIADELETKYNAKICAAYVREAASLYQKRKKLKGDY